MRTTKLESSSHRKMLFMFAALGVALMMFGSIKVIKNEQPTLDTGSNSLWAPVYVPKPITMAAPNAFLEKTPLQRFIGYQDAGLDPDEKRSIQGLLRDVSSSENGRALTSDLFFSSEDPASAAAMYDMILDADLKDASLIVELITRARIEDNVEFKLRIIDLIADHNVREHNPYHAEIEEFLAEMAMHADPQLNAAAVAQWAWYVSHHKGILPVLNTYIFNQSKEARQEIYEMIELNVIKDSTEKQEVALALDALTHADYLEVDTQELKKINALKDRLR